MAVFKNQATGLESKFINAPAKRSRPSNEIVKREADRTVFTAKIVFTRGVKKALLVALLLTLFIFIWDGAHAVYLSIIMVNALHFFSTRYRLILFFNGLKLAQFSNELDEKINIEDKLLPTYTILVPLYFEASMIPYLLNSLSNLNYPVSKLQILLLIEKDDFDTQNAISKVLLPSHIEMVIVPEGEVKTKPNACNYGLVKATGELITIYDAEDRPEPDQLIKVIKKFQQMPDNIVCIQARLCFYNAEENWLTKMFSLEYSTLFNYILPAMAARSCPIPLGGTSNHLKTCVLKELGGWDPYNLTEDADLGMRLAAGYKTITIYSYTPEEATVSLNIRVKLRRGSS